MTPPPTPPASSESLDPSFMPPPPIVPPSGGLDPSLMPPPVTGDQYVGVLMVFYEKTGPVYVEDSATLHPDGTIDLDIHVNQSPPADTGVQVTIYLPGGPITYEGRTTLDPSTGTIGLDLNIAPPAPSIMPV